MAGKEKYPRHPSPTEAEPEEEEEEQQQQVEQQQEINHVAVPVATETGGSDSSEDSDIFMRAVEIAVIAEKARRQSVMVTEKVRFIEDLARRAGEESKSLEDVARSLASTATAVATVALQVCSFDSFNEAFASKIGYSKKIDLHTFTNIVERGGYDWSTQSRDQFHQDHTHGDTRPAVGGGSMFRYKGREKTHYISTVKTWSM